MAFQPLSVGDILMLSQTAWKIGRAFTHGKKSAPTEFARVEHEANALSGALKLAAETLHADDSILASADSQTVQAVWAILESAERSLNDLESFVERYQIIKRRETSGGYTVERSWSDAVLANYKTLKWTTEGGNVKQLQDMLQMHTNTINLTMQALQTRSLARLEKTVMPMAENVASIHERVTGDLGSKIDDVHRVIMAVASSTPSLQASDRMVANADHQRQLSSGSSFIMPLLLESPAVEEHPPTEMMERANSGRCDSAIATPSFPWVNRSASLAQSPKEASWVEHAVFGSPGNGAWPLVHSDFDTRRQLQAAASTEAKSDYSRLSDLAESPDSARFESRTGVGEYGRAVAGYSGSSQSPTLPSKLETRRPVDHSQQTQQHNGSPGSTSSRRSNTQEVNTTMMKLPSPALEPRHPPGGTVATPRSLLTPSPEANKTLNTTKRHLGVPLESPQPKAAFKKLLFRNAVTLCDARGTLVEYAQHNANSADPRYDTEMVSVCKEARICVIRKRENREHGGTRLATSIWTLSDNATVRCQQKLSEHAETVPYCSFFDAQKISIGGSTNDEMTLRYHGAEWNEASEKEVRTGWVNYLFASDFDANAFQSAVFGRTVVGSFQTSKTTVIHDGFKGVFAFEEQFAKMDRLRLFEDDGVATLGAGGGVLALLHVSSTFGTGWAKWWINSSRQQIHIKRDGERSVKIKGLDLTVPGSLPVTQGPARRPSIVDEHVVRVDTARLPVKQVTGLRVEFETVRERDGFLTLVRRLQERMLLLPYI